jgi:para-aminobenzoate synthetase/4-amino-4-deoxychorismate lyase
MIVDMVRNDLGRVCATGSVQVPRLFTAEKYGTVWQMTTTVTCRLSEGADLAPVLAATFPGASITGAPKRRTMEIIRELEPEPRGVYCGALGLIEPGGEFTLNLPIRTLVHRAGEWDLGIGAGIVWDSDAQAEYEETLLKASFAFRLTPDLRLFETLLLEETRRYTYLPQHLARLAASAEYWTFPFDREKTQRALAVLAQAGHVPIVVRLELDQDGRLRFSTRNIPTPPGGPVRVLLSAQPTDSSDRYLYHKTTRRALYDQERHAALAQDFFEVLFRNERGNLTEGAITNLFVRTREGWLTPPLEEGLLPGIWRESFLRETGAEERPITLEQLAEAEEVVVGNSVRGKVQVGEIWEAGRVRWAESS